MCIRITTCCYSKLSLKNRYLVHTHSLVNSNAKKGGGVSLCIAYLACCLLLLKTCACNLSWDRLIIVPLINRAFSLSCPWEDLSTYPLKINIPDQWNTHQLPWVFFVFFHIPLSVKINHNCSCLIVTVAGCEWPN